MCMTIICYNLLRQGSTITRMEDYEIQVGMTQFLGWHRDNDSYCGCMGYCNWLPVMWRNIISFAQKIETV